MRVFSIDLLLDLVRLSMEFRREPPKGTTSSVDDELVLVMLQGVEDVVF
jgi:hypothetical protein